MLSLTLWVSRAGWAVHIPTIFLSQWLNIKRWQTPGSPHLPPPSHHPSFLHLFPLCLLFPRSSPAPRTLTPHHSSQPQAPSPRPPFGHHGDWKVVQKHHLVVWRLKFSTRESFHFVPSLLWYLSCCWLCAQKMPTPSFFFFPIFPPMSHLFHSKEHIFEVSVSKHCSCGSEFPLHAEIWFYPSACINNDKSFYLLMTLNGCRCW